jgi:hypothetical protein
LKRLLRETFEELVKVKERLSFVEQVAGIQEETEQLPGTSTLHSLGAQMPTYKKSNQRASSLSGSLVLGGGLLWEDENESTDMVRDASLSEISKLGVRLGTDLLLRFSGMVRGGRDSVLAEVQVDPGEDQFALQKITYHCNALNWMKAIFLPFGASVQDVAFTLNPLAGQGLTSLIQHGSLLHQAIMGRAMGTTVSLQRAWLSAAWFSPQSMAPLPVAKETDHVFLQAIVAPSTHLSVGLAMMEPFQTSFKTISDDQPSDGLQSNQAISIPTAEKSRRYAALVALRSSKLVMHGWATLEGDSAMYRSWNGTKWGLCIGPKPRQAAGEPGSSWAVAVGRLGEGVIRRWQEAIQPDTYEVSAQIHFGEGMSVIPGIVTLRRNDHTTVFAGLKTCWQF